jgi:hypothetical protein
MLKTFLTLFLASAPIVFSQNHYPLQLNASPRPFLSRAATPTSFDSPIVDQARIFSRDSAFSTLGRFPWGPCDAVGSKGNYAFIGNGFLFQSLDLSRADSPQVASEYLLESVLNDIAIRDSLAYVAVGRGLTILRIRDPRNIRFVSSIQTSGLPTSVHLADSFAFVTPVFGQLTTVDISNPSDPRVLGRIQIPNTYAPWFTNRGRIGYTDDFVFSEIQIIDATNPRLMRASYFNPGGRPTFGYAQDTLLYINVNDNDVKVYSISTPLSPRYLTQFIIGTHVSGVVQRDNLLYISTKDSGLQVLNISNLQQPRELKRMARTVPPRTGGFRPRLDDSTLHIANGVGMWSVSVAPRDTLRNLSFFSTGYFPRRMEFNDNKLFVAQYFAGLRILDATDAANLKPLGIAEIPSGCTDIAISGNYAYCTTFNINDYNDYDSTNGVWVIDISNPRQPAIVAHKYIYTALSGYLTSIAVASNKVFVTKLDSGLVIIDVSDPRNPVEVGRYRTGGYVLDFATRDNIGYLALADSGMIILNVSDPANPTRMQKILNSVAGITLKDTLAFVAAGSGLAILSITSPTDPTLLGFTTTSGGRSYVDIAATEKVAYLAYGILSAVDIRDLRAPREFAILDEPFPVPDFVSLKGDTLFTADVSGIWTLRQNPITSVDEIGNFAIANEFELHQNYPNPFNPTTIVTFSVARRSFIVLDVFNILGQKVANIFEGIVETGKYSFRFDAHDLSAGVYFCRLKAPAFFQTRKMLYVR